MWENQYPLPLKQEIRSSEVMSMVIFKITGQTRAGCLIGQVVTNLELSKTKKLLLIVCSCIQTSKNFIELKLVIISVKNCD